MRLPLLPLFNILTFPLSCFQLARRLSWRGQGPAVLDQLQVGPLHHHHLRQPRRAPAHHRQVCPVVLIILHTGIMGLLIVGLNIVVFIVSMTHFVFSHFQIMNIFMFVGIICNYTSMHKCWSWCITKILTSFMIKSYTRLDCPFLRSPRLKSQLSTFRTLQLVIENLPQLPGNFLCAFSALGKVLMTNATRTNTGVSCTTPR